MQRDRLIFSSLPACMVRSPRHMAPLSSWNTQSQFYQYEIERCNFWEKIYGINWEVHSLPPIFHVFYVMLISSIDFIFGSTADFTVTVQVHSPDGLNQWEWLSQAWHGITVEKCPGLTCGIFALIHLFYFSTSTLLRNPLNRYSLGSFNFFLSECSSWTIIFLAKQEYNAFGSICPSV